VAKRSDLDTVILLGSGPIVIGQACEFDYSGAQACKALRALGYRVALVNSNPATIMTDPEFADATYLEPLTPASVAQVVAAERATRGEDARIAMLPTLGGQTALNLATTLDEQGALDKHGVELIGAGIDAIALAEDRRRFSQAMADIGLDTAGHTRATTFAQARRFADAHGFPLLVRSSYTLGGAGSGVARDASEFEAMVEAGLAASPIGEVQIDESLLGWKEFELEVMRDGLDSCVVVCAIENVDPMGVHTGDSITVAPALTLPDPDYQRMRDAAFAVMREVGVATGGSNVQFAVHPHTGRQCVVEMNPRVSRSSALASKATGFPIAKIAAQLAVGLTLDEIANDITGRTKAAFEPTLDYVVTKIPRFAFEKFPGTDERLTTRMKSVGEVMAIGRSFPESLGKALASLEDGTVGLDGGPGAGGEVGAAGGGPGATGAEDDAEADAELWHRLGQPTADRILRAGRVPDLAALVRDAAGRPVGAAPDGEVVDRLAAATGYDRWFAWQLAEVRAALLELGLAAEGRADRAGALGRAKRHGVTDAVAAAWLGGDAADVRAERVEAGVTPVFKTVDTCAGEFPAVTPYHYSSYETETEVAPSPAARVIILGSGPNRIGQGIEFDYCCVHAVYALREAGYETVMVNCNPETVSTDYDTADRLYFEPLTLEHVLAVYHAELAATATPAHPHGDPEKVGVLVQLGGQTPLRLATGLAAAGARILGTQPEAIDHAEDRGRFARVLDRVGIAQPDGGMAADLDEALGVAGRVGFPVLVRPSYVLGGRAMDIVYTAEQMRAWLQDNAGDISPAHPVLIDEFLESAIEVDVDAVYDGQELFLGGVMEHIEEAGVHSGDSACVIPPSTLGRAQIAQLRDYTERIADALGTRGLINIQYAVRDTDISVIEANPRASRTVPFVSKATGVPLAKVAARVMAGATLAQLRLGDERQPPLVPAVDAAAGPEPRHTAVKEAVLPFDRFPGVDSRLGPEMRSTGEVMGLDRGFGVAFAKSQAGTGSMVLPTGGTVFTSIADRDKRAMVYPVKRLAELGFRVLATEGTAETLRRAGVEADIVAKHSEAAPGRPTIVDRIRAGEVDLVLNTPMGSGPRVDGYEIRTAAVGAGVPCITTLSGILAAVQGVEALRLGHPSARPLQAYHAELDAARAAGEQEG
jgi:carbamoyl-phosphate synthase large subunit